MSALDNLRFASKPAYIQGASPTEIENDAFVEALRNGALSSRLRSQIGATIQRDASGIYVQVANTSWGVGTEGDCWATIPGLTACLGPKIMLSTYGVKECISGREDLMFADIATRGESLLPVSGLSAGDKSMQIADRLAAQQIKFFRNRAAIQGLTTGTGSLKYTGLAEYLSMPGITSTIGDPFTGMEQLACVGSMVGGNWIAATHPFAARAIRKRIQNTPAGQASDWSINGNTISYQGITIYESYLVPFDTTNQTTQLYLINTEYVGIIEWDGSLDGKTKFVKETFNDTGACMETCLYWMYGGAVIVTDPRGLAVIDDVPVDGACLAASVNYPGVINPTKPYLF